MLDSYYMEDGAAVVLRGRVSGSLLLNYKIFVRLCRRVSSASVPSVSPHIPAFALFFALQSLIHMRVYTMSSQPCCSITYSVVMCSMTALTFTMQLDLHLRLY